MPAGCGSWLMISAKGGLQPDFLLQKSSVYEIKQKFLARVRQGVRKVL